MRANDERFTQRLFQRLSQGGANFASSLILRAMFSDRWRDVVFDELRRRLIRLQPEPWEAHLPAQVHRDKQDMSLALLESTRRAIAQGHLNRKVVGRLLRVFLVNTVMRQDEASAAAVEAFKDRHGGEGPPSLIVVSPTRACNLRCQGCYASATSQAEHLSWPTFERIIQEARDLWGVRFFTISGGEPLAYRSEGKTLLDAVEKYQDCFFLMYTNGTLIDRRVAHRMAETGNLTPAISVEGFEARTDQRRGKGVFRRVLRAMERLRDVGVPFGISLTATRWNVEEILSDEFIDFFFERQKAVYGWIFQYMPIGKQFTLDLQVTPEQRVWMWRRTWQIIRERKIMLADFWNCGTTSGGCIAAGRFGGGGYLYIDWNGKVMPCVFVPYAVANVREIYARGGSLDEVYDRPYLKAIRQWQGDYALRPRRTEACGNLLLPCSLRDHYDSGRRLIDAHRPEPEDAAAAEALADPGYYEGMVAYDRALQERFDPIWREHYLGQCVPAGQSVAAGDV